MNIGQTIKTIRESKGLSQKRLAEMAGISANAMCSIEKEYCFPYPQTIRQICSAMQITTGYLLFASLTEDDIPQEKLPVFRVLQKPILDLL